MQIIAVTDTPNQTVTVTLDNQACQINAYMLDTGGAGSNGALTDPALYMDLLVAGEPVIQGVICQNLNRIVRDAYLGFSGDLMWFDTQGTSDPTSPGLGSRYQLIYLEPADIAGRA